MNCIIVDDEFPARKELSYFIASFSSIKITEEFDDCIEALEYVKEHKPDIIFLDINMPKLDGIQLAKILNDLTPKPTVVFVTAYREYAADAFEIEAFDYILKPYSESRIISTLRKLENIQKNSLTSNKIAVWKSDKMVVVNIYDICYCEANEREVIIYTAKDKYIMTSSISDFYKKLPHDSFFKCHRSFIVNLNKIIEIIPWFNNTYMLKIEGIDANIPVSRNNISEFKQIMGI